jgi:hypothetical protein
MGFREFRESKGRMPSESGETPDLPVTIARLGEAVWTDVRLCLPAAGRLKAARKSVADDAGQSPGADDLDDFGNVKELSPA